ncbi:MAG TPA: hypothetical protein VGL93_26975 [Streptosporangiaceae bacterium]|jgi:hypothetical protein
MADRTSLAQRNMMAGTAFLAAPIFMLVYGVVRFLGGRHSPSAAWTLGHLAFLVALFLFGFVLLGLRRRVDPERRGLRTGADIATVAGFLGLAAMIIQISVDLVVGLVSADHAAMSRTFEAFQSWPGVTPAIYTIMPQLLFVGFVALSILAAVSRRTHPSVPILITIGTAFAAANLNLLPAAAVCYALALAPLGLHLIRQADTRPELAHT